jgi:hypothetical protein
VSNPGSEGSDSERARKPVPAVTDEVGHVANPDNGVVPSTKNELGARPKVAGDFADITSYTILPPRYVIVPSWAVCSTK